MAGGGAFEMVLTAVLVAVTGGIGAAAMLAGKARLLVLLKKLGELFEELAKLRGKVKLRRDRETAAASKESRLEDYVTDEKVPRPEPPPKGNTDSDREDPEDHGDGEEKSTGTTEGGDIVPNSKSFSITVRDGNNSRNVEWFDQSAVINDMSSSPIGRTVLDAAESNQIRLQFSRSYYREGLLGPENIDVGGVTFPRSVGQNLPVKSKVFLPKAGSNSRAAEIAIHEGVHGLGVGGSRRAEVLARAAEVLHRTGAEKVPVSELLKIYRKVNEIPEYTRSG